MPEESQKAGLTPVVQKFRRESLDVCIEEFSCYTQARETLQHSPGDYEAVKVMREQWPSVPRCAPGVWAWCIAEKELPWMRVLVNLWDALPSMQIGILSMLTSDVHSDVHRSLRTTLRTRLQCSGGKAASGSECITARRLARNPPTVHGIVSAVSLGT